MSVRWVSRPCPQTNLWEGGSESTDANWSKSHKRTEQLNFEANLRQRLYEVRSLLRRDVSAIASEHVQPVRPVRPARRVGRNRVCEGALGREQRERQGRRDELGAARRCCSVARDVKWHRAVRGGDFGDQCEVEALR